MPKAKKNKKTNPKKRKKRVTPVNSLVEAKIKELIAKSKNKGFVTEKEILYYFPEVEDDIELLEKIAERLKIAGIEMKTSGELWSFDEEIDEKAIISDLSSATNLPTPIQQYLKEINKIPLLTKEEERELTKRAAKGDMEARERLFKSNLRLVFSIAKRYYGKSKKLSFMDLLQEGNLGLAKAIDRFDPKKGFKLSTYATWWIRQSITRAMADYARTIRLPVHIIEQLYRLNKIQKKLSEELGRQPSPEELAREAGISEKKIHRLLRLTKDVTSLETTIGESETELGALVRDEKAISPMHEASLAILREKLLQAVEELPPKEREIIKLRYGLKDGIIHTLEEIGKIFGITRERARQLEIQAINQLRNHGIILDIKDNY